MEIVKGVIYIAIFITVIISGIYFYEKIEPNIEAAIKNLNVKCKNLWDNSPIFRLMLTIPTGIIEYIIIYYFIAPDNMFKLKLVDLTVGDILRIFIAILLFILIMIFQIKLAFDSEFRKWLK